MPIEEVSHDKILDLCRNFVAYDEELDVFRFAHLSVREFLEERSEFSKESCHVVTAVGCLSHIIGASHDDNGGGDKGISLILCADARTEELGSARFLEYANQFWTEHCQSLSPSHKAVDVRFRKALETFILDDNSPISPLNRWTTWAGAHWTEHCRVGGPRQLWAVFSKAPNPREPGDLRQFWRIYFKAPNHLSRVFFIAIQCDFTEIAANCLQSQSLEGNVRDSGLLLASTIARHTTFDDLSLIMQEERCGMTEQVVPYAVGSLDEDKMPWLLDLCTEVKITPRILVAFGCGVDERKLAVLMSRRPGLAIDGPILQAAFRSYNPDAFRLLLTRVRSDVITGTLLRRLIDDVPSFCFDRKRVVIENLRHLLEQAEDDCLTSPVVVSVLSYEDFSLIKAVLARIGCITEDIMLAAVPDRGYNLFNLMLQHGGVITDRMLEQAAAKGGTNVWQCILGLGYKVTPDLVRIAMSIGYTTREVMHLLMDHLDEPTLTTETFEHICQEPEFGPVDIALEIFVDRTAEGNISETTMMISARYGGILCMKKMLEKAQGPRITEDVLMAAMLNRDCAVLRCLLDQDKAFKMTGNTLLAAVYAERKAQIIVELLQRKHPATVISIDVFIAAFKQLCGEQSSSSNHR